LSQQNVRGILGVLIDLLNWFRIYKQRDFWIQIAAAIVGILLWGLIYPEEAAATPMLALLSFIMTNVVWAASKKPYSCIVGSSIGYGIYNLAVGAIVKDLSVVDAVIQVFVGMVIGFVFSWFAFFIFTVLGLIKWRGRDREKTSSDSNVTDEK
jgi:hypothetical protein